MHPYLVSALGAFRLLLRDYEHLLEYVHPDHANMHVYSHRTYELLLRASTEFESISKGAAVDRGIIKASDEPNIVHLSPLLHALGSIFGGGVGIGMGAGAVGGPTAIRLGRRPSRTHLVSGVQLCEAQSRTAIQ